MALRILVLSDLHAFVPSDSKTRTDDVSFLRATNAIVPGTPDPIQAAIDTICQEGLSVDWVVCPGDLADKANPDAQAFAWQKLEHLRHAVGAKHLIGTAGNHDIDSRLKHTEFDPKGALQSLQPLFPGIDELSSDRYWSRNFHVFHEDRVLLLNVNSAAFHGMASADSPNVKEYLHGRVSQRTIDAIAKTIQDKSADLHILLTHHHPERDQSIYDSDYSEMQFGSKLLNDLQQLTASSWFVLHGHQHYPRLFYGRGDAYSPTIFSAGSATAQLNGEQARRSVNQFYHITFELDGVPANVDGPAGIIRAWNWSARSRWEPAAGELGIPDFCGFGFRPAVKSIAQQIVELVAAQKEYIVFNELYRDIPELKYITKGHFQALVTELDKRPIEVTRAQIYKDTILRNKKAGTSA